ncbi:MAG: extensin family protein [Hyphomonas sp.]|uniref:extensin-like domain-containing protein n=1 Tax=Hyphomonas sp. TaxID=87 RepID=UPI00352714B6
MTEFRAWLLLITVPALCVALFLWMAPPRHNPFAPVDLTERPGLGTWHKLTRAKKHPDVCFRALDEAGVRYTLLEDSPKGEKCGLYNGLTLDQSLTPYSATLRMTCAETAALYVWERHVARPAAMELLGSPIARIETYGSFSCRNIAGSGRLSEHAAANAIDISGFRLKDGRLIDVKSFWGKGGKEDRFLHRLHSGACDLFSVTLGPDYNAAHKDHFHMDMGSGRACE